MSKTAVFIATTEGPTRLQRITAEAPDVRSVICLGGRAMVMPISPDYDTFVRRPTGIIEACYGHSAYRMDISDPIGSGLSWQLGAFLGHALANERRLAANNDGYNRIVWASGEVNCDLTLHSVNDIRQKLQRSRDLFDDLIADGTEIVIAVPGANRADAEAVISELTLSSPGKLKFIAAESALEALAALRLKKPRKRANLPIKLPNKKTTRRIKKLSAVASVTVLATAALLGASSTIKDSVVAAAKTTGLLKMPISAVVLETLAPAGGNCAEVHFDIVAPQISEKNISGPRPAKTINLHRLCDIRYRITNGANGGQKFWILATRDNLSGTAFRTRAVAAGQGVAAKQTYTIDARPPRRLTSALQQSHLVFAIASEDAALAKHTAALFAKARSIQKKSQLNQLVRRAKAEGVKVLKIARHFYP
ncbi:MAG: hypothetical protein CMM52_14105 [Rhodospirillaceae bacterium]|nr:hypothetical protein [Rhodospirillaceae bacterium]|tara:strand:+ start:38761 stop:40026 length:1266 start_codon:yes stop_codon:yes gene_type:complete